MNQFSISFGTVAPTFILVAVGYLLRRFKQVDEHFIKQINGIVFNIAFPILLFKNMYTVDLAIAFNPNLVLYAVIGVTFQLLLTILLTYKVKDGPRRSSYIQAGMMSSFISIGVAMCTSLFGEDNISPLISLIPFNSSLQLIFCILVLSWLGLHEDEQKITAWTFAKPIVTNRILWGTAAGLILNFSGVELPKIAQISVNNFAGISVPMALLCLGAQFRFDAFQKGFGSLLRASVYRLFIIPAITLLPAIFMHFTGSEFAALFFTLSCPVSTSAFSLSLSMGGDAQYTGQLVLSTTLLSFLSVFLWVFLFRTMGLL